MADDETGAMYEDPKASPLEALEARIVELERKMAELEKQGLIPDKGE